MSAPREPTLLQRVAGGDPEAVRRLVDEYTPLIWTLARRQLGDGAAEDVVQEVFIHLWKDAERFDPALGSELTFVATIARRRVIDQRRRRGRGPLLEELVEEPQRESRELEGVDASDELERVAQALAELPAGQRRVLRLAVVEGLTHREISERAGLPLGTVKSHVRRGLERVRQRLGDSPSPAGAERSSSETPAGPPAPEART